MMRWLVELLVTTVLVGAGADRPSGDPKQTRSVVMASKGMVATSQPLAAMAGVRILQEGGNAVDAALAANAVLGVVEPMSCGIGGDLFAIVWDAKTQKLYGLNASGRSPYRATRTHMEAMGLKKLPERGPLTWSTPGCVDGWDQLHRRFGHLPWPRLLEPAIQHAEEGFPLTEIIGASWRDSLKLLRATPDAANTFLVDGKPPRVGQSIKNPHLAATYRLLAEKGRDAFYRGTIAERIVAFSERQGGLFSARDFLDQQSTWVEPVNTDYRGHQVWQLPPNTQGIAVLQMLNMLEPFDIRGMKPNSADYLHLFVETKKIVFADRATYYADREAERGLPIARLISKDYARQRLQLYDARRAALRVPPGDIPNTHADTVYLTVVDKDRNAVSLIQSIYFAWGSGLTPGDLGFMLQNRGSLFALDAKHHNRLEPGKRPFHTIIPGMVTKSGKPWLSFGVMGGDMQPQGQVQVLCNMIDHGMNVQQATDAARCQHVGSDAPTGITMRDGGKVQLESGIDDAILADLRARGHKVERGKAFGGYQAILIDWDQGVLQGGSDPRKDGAAIGY